MKFSIVTVSYNQAAFLRECIDSVLSQEQCDIEYIVVDPGSTDGSREIIDEYGSSLIKIYERDEGAADGLNKGFARATGQIYAYLNSDDRLHPGALKKVLDYFNSYDIDVLYGHAHVVDDAGDFLRRCYSDNFSLTAAAYGASTVIQPSTFFLASAYKNVGGFNIANKSNWDGELFIDLALSGARMMRVPDFFSDYRVHQQSITGSGKLHDLHKKHSRRMFKKILERDYNSVDWWLSWGYRIKKHLTNWPATLERLQKGPVFASHK